MSKPLALYINAILFVFVVSLCIAGKPQITYEKYRADFKHTLYERQQGIMNEVDYKEFIERYLQEAEKTLQIPQYLKQNPYCKSCARYFACLLDYNVAYLHAYAKAYSGAQKVADSQASELALVIQQIKTENALNDLDAQQEFVKTKKLFERANHRLYKKLGFGIRIFNFFRSLGS